MNDNPAFSPRPRLLVLEAQEAPHDFLASELASTFAVTRCRLATGDAPALPAADEIDIVLLLGLEHLLPYCQAHGLRTAAIPLWDRSGTLPDLHWGVCSAGAIGSFSRQLQLKMARAGVASRLFKFFPPPGPVAAGPGEGRLHAFVREGASQAGRDGALACRLLGACVDALHVQQAPPGTELPPPLPRCERAALTVSAGGADVHGVLAECNVHFAPQASAGLCLDTLDAMAAGMLVVAPDQAVFNEYIAHGVNGILYTPSTPPLALDAATAHRLGAAARAAAGEGHRRWREQVPEFLRWLADTPLPPPVPAALLPLLAQLHAARCAGRAAYVRLLERNPALLETIAPDWLREHAQRAAAGGDSARDEEVPVLLDGELVFAQGGARRFLEQGWSHDEPGFLWMDGTSAALRFRLPDHAGEPSRLRIECLTVRQLADQPQHLAVVFNGALCGTMPVGTEATPVEFDLPAPPAAVNTLQLFARHWAHVGGDPRRLSVALVRIALA